MFRGLTPLEVLNQLSSRLLQRFQTPSTFVFEAYILIDAVVREASYRRMYGSGAKAATRRHVHPQQQGPWSVLGISEPPGEFS